MSENYKRTIYVSANADAAFAALTSGFEHWWTKPDQLIHKVGDRAKFTFPPGVSYWTFEAVKLAPSTYVELECVDALHIHEGQPKEIEQEWLGSSLKWSISPEADGTKIELEHVGLTPNLLCFDICQAGWDMFFTDSLKEYLNTGVGKPHKG
ncbi:hypothetical protein F9L33_09900 [Amylibacter sp. SFDW26]|uniref:SRPBCC domain-containing protein n=1 Tax=Amylibacter sp. SFDW26 TaxID=2652722 RepID=UPI001261C796|nr:SRPBCC domain-containing protein [Amylibacter sp. SFDW26]KAB7613680.1 hypothetical protein F9L33_09900 [Amylibacter sp. SFDW26]